MSVYARRILAGMAVLSISPLALAAEGKRGGGDLTLFQLMFSGGPMGIMVVITIILMSIAGLALTIEHFVSIKREKLAPPYILTELENLLDEQEYEEAMDLCESEDCFLTRVVHAGLSRMEGGPARMEAAVAEAGEGEAALLHQKISWLALIGALAPMMGLLGTVIGMISAFSELASSEGGASAHQLAGGIYTALVTTAMGLMLAIPVMLAYQFFRNRVIKVVQEVSAFSGSLLDRFSAGAGGG